MKPKPLERNRNIAEGILSGGLLTKVALDYGLSATRVKQILHSYCYEKDRDVYLSIAEPYFKSPKVTQLREYADVFLAQDDYSITLNSSLYNVDVLPKRLVNSLRPENILTVEDLFAIDPDVLINAPNVGKKGIELVKAFITKYRDDLYR